MTTPPENPEQIVPAVADDWEWTILHTRPRCEKKAQRVFDRAGFTTYLPLRRREHRYGNRRRVFDAPLFPGYVFCAAPVSDLTTLRQEDCVANLLRVLDQDRLVHQLRQVARALAEGRVLDVMPRLEKGMTVRVTGGPLKGLEGVVERIAGKTRVVLNIEMIQQAVCVEVDGAFVERA